MSDQYPYDFVWQEDIGADAPVLRSRQISAASQKDAWTSFWKNCDTHDYVSCFLGMVHLSSSEQFPNLRE